MKKIIFVFLFIISCSQIENDSSQLIEEQLSKVIPIELNIDSIKESQLPNFYEVIPVSYTHLTLPTTPYV